MTAREQHANGGDQALHPIESAVSAMQDERERFLRNARDKTVFAAEDRIERHRQVMEGVVQKAYEERADVVEAAKQTLDMAKAGAEEWIESTQRRMSEIRKRERTFKASVQEALQKNERRRSDFTERQRRRHKELLDRIEALSQAAKRTMNDDADACYS